MLISVVIYKLSNQCVSQVNQKAFLQTSVEIEILLCQSTSFSVLTCKGSRLSLDPKIWFVNSARTEKWTTCLCSEVMREQFNLKMSLPKFCPLGKSFITMSKVVLGLLKKVAQKEISCVEG